MLFLGKVNFICQGNKALTYLFKTARSVKYSNADYMYIHFSKRGVHLHNKVLCAVHIIMSKASKSWFASIVL